MNSPCTDGGDLGSALVLDCRCFEAWSPVRSYLWLTSQVYARLLTQARFR